MDYAYIVVGIRECEECKGWGRYDSSIWQKYHRDVGDNSEALTPAQWAAENGFHGVDPMGPEEIVCSACNGNGKVEESVPLHVALHDLGVANSVTMLEALAPLGNNQDC